MSDSSGYGSPRRIRTIVLVLVGALMVGGAAAALTTLLGRDGSAARPVGGSGGTPFCADVGQSSAGASSADQASALLFQAWQSGDCSAAGNVATQDAVQSLFAEPWSSDFQRPVGCFTPDRIQASLLPPPGGVRPGEEVCNSPDGPWELQFWTAPSDQGGFVVQSIRVFHGKAICHSTDPSSCDTELTIRAVPPSCPAPSPTCAKKRARQAGIPIAWIPGSAGYTRIPGSGAIAALDRFAWEYVESGDLEFYVASGETHSFSNKVPTGLRVVRRFMWHGSRVTEWAGYPSVGDWPYITWLIHFQWEWHNHPYALEVFRSVRSDVFPPMGEGLRAGERAFSALRYAFVRSRS